jgi:hypothetical protein
MAEVEPPDGVSARKLVLETAKFNVITAYSVAEALETLKTFPKVHVLVLHSSLCKNGECDRVLGDAKKRNSKMLTIAITPSDSGRFKRADYTLSSHEPQELLNLLRSHFGDPRVLEQKGTGKSRS